MGIRIASFFAFAMFTLVISAAQSQQTRDALQERDIRALQIESASMNADIRTLSLDLTALRSSMERFVGIGIGFGAALTILQAFQVILQVRNGRKL